MSIDFTDIFCGAHRSSIGLVGAGLELKLAANRLGLRALDDVLDPKHNDAGHDLSVQHRQRRVEREQQALRQAS